MAAFVNAGRDAPAAPRRREAVGAAFARAFAASAVSTSPFSVGDHGSSPFSSASITLPLGVDAAVLEAIACGGGGGGGASDAELSRLLRGPSAVDVRWRTIAT